MKILSVPFEVKPWYKQLFCKHHFIPVVSREQVLFVEISKMSAGTQRAIMSMAVSYSCIYLKKQDLIIEIEPLTEQCNLCGRSRPALQKGKKK